MDPRPTGQQQGGGGGGGCGASRANLNTSISGRGLADSTFNLRDPGSHERRVTVADSRKRGPLPRRGTLLTL